LDFDQIEPGVSGHAQRFVPREDSDLLSVRADHAHLRNTDFHVLAVSLFGADNAISIKPVGQSTWCQADPRKRSTSCEIGMLPRSSPDRARPAMSPFSFSRSPTTRRYGTFCNVCSRIL